MISEAVLLVEAREMKFFIPGYVSSANFERSTQYLAEATHVEQHMI